MEGKYDVVLIGAGVMSATLATMLHEIRPTIDILIIESQTFPAMESSAAFNNAGTGHAGFCELNYSVLKDDKVDISKAIGVNTAFEQSKQLWATLVQDKKIKNDFVHQVPHISFVTGEENVSFLEKRYNAMKEHYLFQDIEFSKDFNVISEWCPLITTGRNKAEIIGATRVKRGLDVDYGNLTNQLFASLSRHVTFQFNSTVNTITKTGDSRDKLLKALEDILDTRDKRYMFLFMEFRQILPNIQIEGSPRQTAFNIFNEFEKQQMLGSLMACMNCKLETDLYLEVIR